jgi:hypothetical protein
MRDASGALLRTLGGTGHKGVNRLYWDLRSEPAQRPDPREPYNPVFRPPPRGPLVSPGTYTAVVSVPGRSDLRGQVVVQGDPLVAITEVDRRTRDVVIQDLYEMQKTGVAASAALRRVTEQLTRLRPQLDGTAEGTMPAPAVRSSALLVTVQGAPTADGSRVAQSNGFAGAIEGHRVTHLRSDAAGGATTTSARASTG